MKKYTIDGHFSVVPDFLEDLEERGEKQDYILALYGGADGQVVLIENGSELIGYVTNPDFDKTWVAKGKKIGNTCFQLYICGDNGNVYTLSLDANRQGINCVSFFCNYHKDLTFDELICGYTQAKLTEKQIGTDEYLQIDAKFNNLYKGTSNLYKTHVTGFLDSEYIILEEFGAFTDMLDYGGIKDIRCNSFIPIYEICAECMDKVVEYGKSLNVEPFEIYDVSTEMFTGWVKNAISSRNLDLSEEYRHRLIQSIVDVFEKDNMDEDTITLCTIKLIMNDHMLEEHATISPERLFGFCIYDNLDDPEELDDIINSFKNAHEDMSEMVIYNTFKNAIEDQQINILMECYNLLEEYYKTVGGDYDALLDFVKDETLCIINQEQEDQDDNPKEYILADQPTHQQKEEPAQEDFDVESSAQPGLVS